MLFDIETALKVKNHYKNALMGTVLTPESGYKIDGIFVCRKGEAHKATDILLDTDFVDRYPLDGVTDDKAKDFEVYVYAYTGVDIYYHELDKNLTDKSIEKIYPVD